MPIHPINWYAGWCLLLLAFLTGAAVGLFFHREDFLGGYASFQRRLLRLGHIACAALGMLNLIYSLAPGRAGLASILFVAGGVTMPVICFLTAWRPAFRHLFFIPVASLVVAVVYTLNGRDGPPGRPSAAAEAARPAVAPYQHLGDSK